MVVPTAHVVVVAEVVVARRLSFNEAGLDETKREAESEADAEADAAADDADAVTPSRERSACPSLRPSRRGEASAPAPESAERAERSVPPSAATDESGRAG